jgi:hypothetical protein
MEDEIHENINAAIVEMERLRAENAAMEEELSIGRELLDRAIKARDTAESKLATITAGLARLLARCEVLEKVRAHYADARNWTTATDFDNNYVIYSANFPMPGEGWAVAREALAGEEGKNND